MHRVSLALGAFLFAACGASSATGSHSPPRAAPPRHGTVRAVTQNDISDERGDGLFDDAKLIRAIESRRDALGACFTANTSVTLHLTAHVSPQGATASFAPTDDASLARCATDALGPALAGVHTEEGSGTVEIDLPLTFEPAG